MDTAERIVATIAITFALHELFAVIQASFDTVSKECSLGHPNRHSSLISSLSSISTSFGIGLPIGKSSNLTFLVFITSLFGC